MKKLRLFAGICFYFAAIIYLMIPEKRTMGIVFIILGSVQLALLTEKSKPLKRNSNGQKISERHKEPRNR